MTDPTCAACGHPRSNHPYRHRFVGPSLEDDVKDLEAKLAKAVEVLEQCEIMLRLRGHDEVAAIARTTLAEIKGESHE